MQLACHLLGGEVKPAPSREFGRAVCRVHEADGLFAGVPTETVVWMSHGDQVQTVNGDFVPLAATDTCPVAAVRHRSRPVYGLQFHPEVSHTPHGSQILHNFLYDVCGCQGLWQIGSFLDQTVADLRAAHRQAARHLRPVRRRRFVGDGGAAAQGGRAAGGVHLRGQRPAAAGRGRGGAADVPRPFQGRPARRRCRATASSTRWTASPTRRRSGTIIGHVFIDVFKDEAQHIDGRPVPGPGHAVPRRDRERRRRRRPGRQHQDAPQRRRVAQGTRLRADRAAEGPVQGRGAPPRPGAGPARERSSGGIRSPAPAWRCAASATSPRSGSTCCARPTRSCWRS